MDNTTFTCFLDGRKLRSGSLDEIGALVRSAVAEGAHGHLVFDDATGAQVDIDLRTPGAASQAAPTGSVGDPSPRRGRPRLGVVAREVTLLPRHWEWLASQPGGASVVLRRLVDAARKADEGSPRASREAAYRFMSALGGNLPDFEEASRALFAGRDDRLMALMRTWPPDIAAHVLQLAGVTRISEPVA
jgi:hypothetical protein